MERLNARGSEGVLKGVGKKKKFIEGEKKKEEKNLVASHRKGIP